MSTPMPGEGHVDDESGSASDTAADEASLAPEEEPDYRFTLANERTFLAWLRTALALIAGGVALVQLVPSFGIPGVRHGLSAFLVASGGVLAVLSVRHWQRVQSAMRRHADLPPNRIPVPLVAALLTVTVLLLVLMYLVPVTGS